ncbi:MAG: hypothetical protein NC320_07960 [Clostridium sp.]|nr:hypothetical protein [Clostridium sp.]MCM1547660.1 hypothetical protein [Ruminococcus sp.]
MKLPTNRRCPWCGEIVKKIICNKYGIKTCGNCGNKYIAHNGTVSKIFVLFSVFWGIIAVLSINHISIAFIYGFFYICICVLSEKIITYERYNDDSIRFSIKKYSAKITFEHDDKFSTEYIKARIFLSDKAVIPICFADENDKPLSHVICINMEDTRRISYTEYECVFSFLPNSHVNCYAYKTCDFYLFDGDRKRIAKGRILDEYNRF